MGWKDPFRRFRFLDLVKGTTRHRVRSRTPVRPSRIAVTPWTGVEDGAKYGNGETCETWLGSDDSVEGRSTEGTRNHVE